VIIINFHQERYVIISVCPYICLSVHKQECAKSLQDIFLKTL